MTWRRADSSFISSVSTVYTQDTADWQLLTSTGIAPNTPPDSVAGLVDVLLRTYGFTGSQPGGFVFVDDVNFEVSATTERVNPVKTASEYFTILPNIASSIHQFRFQLVKATGVRINIYDNVGKKVKSLITQILNPGSHNSIWEGDDDNCYPVPTGIYYGVLEKDGHKPEIKKLVHYINQH